ncbi:hypothetical protein Glove_463g63 [Diversispora epigaea]|uniref:Uncharacterized protein n=1 Tax=Diversispora epigaea TaxID=1348612 RepID=A0A397GMZ7_9GLOM|nr:hypothetical protein Glove_463g63 [Diversispora epigaea]
MKNNESPLFQAQTEQTEIEQTETEQIETEQTETEQTGKKKTKKYIIILMRRSYTYEIIEEGQYPSITYLKYTKGNIFRIPNNYELKTKILQQSRDACRRATVLKPFDNLTPTGQNNRTKQITKSVCNIFNQIAIEKCHPEDNPKLKSIELDIKNKFYQISIGKENTEEIIYRVRAIVQACDKGQVARKGYRTLTSISQDLSREWRVSAERNTITIEMNKFIPISLINLTPLQSDESVNSEIHIDNLEIINNIQESIGKGDGRNVGRKVKQVMITFAILNNKNNLYYPENHHTIILYPEIEKYEILQEKGLKDHQGLNAANSKYFCPWCEISKEQQGDLSLKWKINKTINNIHQNYKCYRGYIRPAIFDMIPLQNWVPNELHIMLRITNVLWRLVIDELKSRNTWGNKARDVIIEEMKRINVRFHFWLEVESSAWQYTSLMGQDKLTVLQHFNLSKLFPHSRAIQIRNLWDNFYLLHKAMKNFNTDAKMFSNDTHAWLHQFLNSDFYQASDITPYIHVLVYHIPKMIKIHNHFDSGGEKNEKGRKSAILDILEHENRILYFYNCNEIEFIHLPKKLRIQTE